MKRLWILTASVVLSGGFACSHTGEHNSTAKPAAKVATTMPAAAAATSAPATQVALPKQYPDQAAPKMDGKTGQIQGRFRVMHEQFVERAKKGDVELLFLGDSITEGWKKAPDTFKQRYEDKYKTANFGIGGDRTQHVLWRIENGELDGIKPKVTVLMIGTNNAKDDQPEGVARGVEKIVKTLRAKTGTKVLLLAIFPRGADNNDPLRVKNEQVNEKLKAMDDGTNVRYLDIGPKFLQPDGVLTREVMPDLLHPNAKAYETEADAIDPLLTEMLKG